MTTVTLDRLLRAQALERGTKTALQAGSERVTYAELDAHAAQVANGLKAAGVGAGDRVAYLGKNTLAYFEYFLGAMKARAVTVPINWRLAGPEVRYVIENARPAMILVEPDFEAVAGEVAPHAARRVIGPAPHQYAAWRDAQSIEEPKCSEDWDEPVLQLYTSGTTGRPKGAVLTHRNLFGLRAAAASLPDWYRWSAEDVSLIAMPVSHVSGTGWGIWTLQHGATGIIAREFDPHSVIDQIVTHRINKMMMVPTAMQIAVRHPGVRAADFSFLKYIYYGGAPLPAALLRECAEVFRCGFVQMYGMTETAGTIVALSPEDHDADDGAHLSSVGRPLPGVELKIVDTAGHTLPPNHVGAITTRSAANMREYFELPAATAQTIDAGGWLRTGDAGRLDEAGFLYLHDRLNDMIITGGENVYPTEVENAIYGHPDVAEVAVIGVPDEKWGEAVKAFIVAKPGSIPEARAIIAWAAERIARYKLPKSVEVVASLPRNHTGKVLRRELRAAYAATSAPHVPPPV